MGANNSVINKNISLFWKKFTQIKDWVCQRKIEIILK